MLYLLLAAHIVIGILTLVNRYEYCRIAFIGDWYRREQMPVIWLVAFVPIINIFVYVDSIESLKKEKEKENGSIS